MAWPLPRQWACIMFVQYSYFTGWFSSGLEGLCIVICRPTPPCPHCQWSTRPCLLLASSPSIRTSSSLLTNPLPLRPLQLRQLPLLLLLLCLLSPSLLESLISSRRAPMWYVADNCKDIRKMNVVFRRIRSGVSILEFPPFPLSPLENTISNKKKHNNFGIFFFYLGCCEHYHTVGLSNKFFAKLSPFTAACCYLCSVHLVMSPSLVLCLYLLYNTHDVHVVFSQLKPSSLQF